MTVNESSLNQAAASQLGKAQGAEAVKPGGARKAGEVQAPQQQSDRVQLSDLSSRLVQMASMESPERVARVDKMAAEFKAGRYQPNSQATSAGIIQDAMRHET